MTECEVYALAIPCHFILLVLVTATQMENSIFIVPGTLIFIVLLETLEQTRKVCYVGNVHHGMQPCSGVSVNKRIMTTTCTPLSLLLF